MKILYAGIRGLPPEYGGFEKHVDQISRYLSREMELDVMVACEKPLGDKLKTSNYHDGVSLIYYPLIPGPRWLSETIFDINIFLSSLFIGKLDIVYYCGLSAGFFTFIPRLLGRKVVVNIGGYDWKNKKFHPILRFLLYINVLCLVIFPNKLVTDNRTLQTYFKKHFLKDTVLIPYPADLPKKSYNNAEEILKKYNLTHKGYFLTITRIEMMNSIEYMILESKKVYKDVGHIPLVIVGDMSTNHGTYLLNKYGSIECVRFLGYIHDVNTLNILRNSALIYIHGQVTGGTSPALLEALASGMIVVSFDSDSNRSTMENTNYYFSYDYTYYVKKGVYREYVEPVGNESSRCLSDTILKIMETYNTIFINNNRSNIELVKHKYSIEKIGQLHLELYKECSI